MVASFGFGRARDAVSTRLAGLKFGEMAASCGLGWQPSVFAPVFYGIQDFDISPPGNGSVPHVRARAFFPSTDGSPENAPFLEGCGRYPLIVFAHGHCASSAEVDHFRAWYELGVTLARCGYVVMVPDLPEITGGIAPLEAAGDLARLVRLIEWARVKSPFRDSLMAPPATGLVGHSRGAYLSARLILEDLVPVRAHASLSGSYPAALRTIPLPKLLTWGTGEELPLVPQHDWEQNFAAPTHVAEFSDAGHWDYIPEDRSNCDEGRGPCNVVWGISADVVTLFFGRYLLPEHWATGRWFPPLPWLHVSKRLVPPFLFLTVEQKFFAAGHFAVWDLLSRRPGCEVKLSWKVKPHDIGSTVRP